MSATITVHPAANDDSTRWLVLATLDGAFPGFLRRFFIRGTTTEHEALGVVGDLLEAVSGRARKLRLHEREVSGAAVDLIFRRTTCSRAANDNLPATSTAPAMFRDSGGKE